MTLTELKKKDVVQIKTGVNLGRADDLKFDGEEARLEGLILFGRAKLFGLLGRQPDLFVPWEEIVRLGQDVILVNTELPQSYAEREGFWQKWLGG